MPQILRHINGPVFFVKTGKRKGSVEGILIDGVVYFNLLSSRYNPCPPRERVHSREYKFFVAGNFSLPDKEFSGKFTTSDDIPANVKKIVENMFENKHWFVRYAQSRGLNGLYRFRWYRKLYGGKWERWYHNACFDHIWYPVDEWSEITEWKPYFTDKEEPTEKEEFPLRIKEGV